MRMQCMRQHRFLRSWLGAVLLSALALCVGVSRADAPGRHYQVAVFTTGLTASPVLAGLQEGLAQLGYVEGKNVTMLMKNTHKVVPNLIQRATRLVKTKPDVLVTVETIHTTAARQMTDHLPIVFT